MGGTFDHLHEGHKFLIKTALSISNKVVIGLTGEGLLVNKKFASKLQSYEERERILKLYIFELSDPSRVEIVKLDNPFGPPIHEADYEGIIVSQETYKAALKINELREENGFQPMIIIVIPLIKDQNNEKISSTSIRAGIK
jgi:pantetheine-phosphate adenylyltransferase